VETPVAAPYYPKTATGSYGDGYDYKGDLKLLTIYARIVVAYRALDA
jgi:hypothetical protein